MRSGFAGGVGRYKFGTLRFGIWNFQTISHKNTFPPPQTSLGKTMPGTKFLSLLAMFLPPGRGDLSDCLKSRRRNRQDELVRKGEGRAELTVGNASGKEDKWTE